MRADNSAHLLTAARRRTEQTRNRALRALRDLDNAGALITFEAVARGAGVSRSWLYAQPDLRATILDLHARDRPAASPAPPQRQRASDASLRRRLEAATVRLHQLESENQQLRRALAEALGNARAQRITGIGRNTPGRQAAKVIGPC